MNKLIPAILLIVLFGPNLFAQKKVEKPKICITQQEYEVYTAIGVLNYQNETTPVQPRSPLLEEEAPGISPETLADFREKNSGVYLLRCLKKSDGKEKSLSKSVQGDASFSRIGFSGDGREALVYSSWSAVGNQCWAGYVLLRKPVDKWEVVKRITSVIC